MTQLSFKEYYESKQQLIKASESNVRMTIEYTVLKYCKVPVINEQLEKEYIPFKPKDSVRMMWEFNGDDPILISFYSLTEGEQHYIPAWTSLKSHEWSLNNCRKKPAEM